MKRRRAIATVVGGCLGLAGCTNILDDSEDISDSDGDGVIDSEDAAPNNPDIQTATETPSKRVGVNPEELLPSTADFDEVGWNQGEISTYQTEFGSSAEISFVNQGKGEELSLRATVSESVNSSEEVYNDAVEQADGRTSTRELSLGDAGLGAINSEAELAVIFFRENNSGAVLRHSFEYIPESLDPSIGYAEMFYSQWPSQQ